MRKQNRVVLMAMSRISVTECQNYPFQVPMEVRVTDLNYATHMGVDQLLGQAHQVRYLFFDFLGFGELDFGDGRTGVAVSDVGIVCKAEVFLRDRLLFEVGVNSIGRSSFRLGFRVTKGKGQPVALIEKGCVAFDYEKSRAVRLPVPVKERLIECYKNSMGL